MARRRNSSTLPGLRPVGRIPGHATEIQYLRNGRAAYYHPFTQRGRVRMIAMRDGSVLLKGPQRIHADDREPGFDRYTGRANRRRNPGGVDMVTLALLAVAAWFLLRSPGAGQPSLVASVWASWTGTPAAPDSKPPQAGVPIVLPLYVPGGPISLVPTKVGASVYFDANMQPTTDITKAVYDSTGAPMMGAGGF